MTSQGVPHPSTDILIDAVPVETPHASFDPNARSNRSLVVRLAFPLAFAAIFATFLALLVGVLRMNKGTFLYTLDDPYIHLALSDQIRHGNYGLYAGTHAAPSSSIIFPFLLAIAAGTPLHPYIPLVINVCALFFTVEVMRRFLLHLKLGTDDFAIAVQATFLFLAALCFNLIGVVFTGLEHSMHIATVAAIVYGLALLVDRGKMPSWLPVAIVLCPLIRYEGLALGVGALAVLALKGHVKTALATSATICALLGGFSMFLHKLGLPLLPSSVLSKSAVVAGGVDRSQGHLFTGLFHNVNAMRLHPAGLIMLLIGVVALCILGSDLLTAPRRLPSRSLMALALLSMIGGHALAGRFGWLFRYEDYLLLGVALLCIYLAQSMIRASLRPSHKDRFVWAGGFAAALMIFGTNYWRNTLNVPLASKEVYEQQLQMHFFVDRFYKGPVAINDLGLISYHNPYPVLDLYGLGSEKARLLGAHATASDYQALVADNDVRLVIIYKDWFLGKIPKTWQPVGKMSLSHPHVAAAFDDVWFYATDDATAARVHGEFVAFRNTLPRGVTLTFPDTSQRADCE